MLEISGEERLQLGERHAGTQRPVPMHPSAAATCIHLTDGDHDALAQATVEPPKIRTRQRPATDQNARDISRHFAGRGKPAWDTGTGCAWTIGGAAGDGTGRGGTRVPARP